MRLASRRPGTHNKSLEPTRPARRDNLSVSWPGGSAQPLCAARRRKSPSSSISLCRPKPFGCGLPVKTGLARHRRSDWTLAEKEL